MKSNHLYVFHSAVGALPASERLHVLLGLCHSRGGKHLVKFPLGKITPGVEISDSMKNHPQISIRMIAVVGCRGREAEEHPKLNDDEHQREDNPPHRHRKTHPVAAQIPSPHCASTYCS